MSNNIEGQPLNELKKLYTGEELLNLNTEEIPCLVEPFFHQAGLVCLAGSSDTGKSTLLRQLAISISTGEESFLGFKTNIRFKSAIYVSTEDLARETGHLLHKQTMKYKPEELNDIGFIFESENLVNNLEHQLQLKRADLVIVDCFSDVFTGDIKDSPKIRSFLQPYQNLAHRYDCLFLFLHHTSKKALLSPPHKDNLLGGVGLEGKMRLVMELRTDLSDPSTKHLCLVKGNYLPSNHKQESYVLNFDESQLLFTNTEERTPFDLLVKKDDDSNFKDKFNKIIELKGQGMSYEEIAKIMGVASKGTITKWISKGKGYGWSTGMEDNEELGQEVE